MKSERHATGNPHLSASAAASAQMANVCMSAARITLSACSLREMQGKLTGWASVGADGPETGTYNATQRANKPTDA